MSDLQSDIASLLKLSEPVAPTSLQSDIKTLIAPHALQLAPPSGPKAFPSAATTPTGRVASTTGTIIDPVNTALFEDVTPAPPSAQEIALEQMPQPVPAGNAALRFVEGISREAGDKPVLLVTKLLERGAEFLGKTQFAKTVGPTDKAVEFFKDFGEFQEHELAKRGGVQGVAGKAGEFVGFMFNPLYIGAFGLTGRLTAPIVRAIAGKVGSAAVEAALKAGATPETARRAAAWRQFAVELIASSPEGALAFGAIGAIEGLGEGGREGMIDGFIQSGKVGLYIGPLFRLAGAAIKKGLLEPMQGRNARRALGLPKAGKLTAEEIERAFTKAATTEGVTGDQLIRLMVAHERLVHPGLSAATPAAEKAATLAPPKPKGVTLELRPSKPGQPVTTHNFSVLREGDFVTMLTVDSSKLPDLRIVNISTETGAPGILGAASVRGASGTLGGAAVRNLLRQLRAKFPQAKTISGERISGARGGIESAEEVQKTLPVLIHAMSKRDAQSVLKFRGKVKQEGVTLGVVEGPEGFRTTTRATTARAAKAEAHEAQINAAANAGEPIPFEVRQEFPHIQFDTLAAASEKAVAKPVPAEGGARVAPEARPKQGGPTKAEMSPEAQAAVESKAQMSAEDIIKNPPLEGRRGLLTLEPLHVVQRFWRKNLLAKGDLPANTFQSKIAKDGAINALLKQVSFTMRDFRKAIRVTFGREGPTKADLEILDKALKGEIGLTGQFAPMKPVIKQMRTEIDALSQRMIDLGMVEGPMRLAFENNKGFYTTRTYRVHTDPKWAKKVPLEIRNKAKALLRSEYPLKSEDEIQGLIDNLLIEGKAAETPFAAMRKVFAKSKLGSKDLSIVTRRNDIPPEIRALWGEFKDPRVNYMQSINKMANLIENQKFLETVRVDGLNKFLFKNPITNSDGQFVVRIAADQSNVMSPLNGLYTTTAIKEAFEMSMGAGAQRGHLFRNYMLVNGFVKLAKTVGSVQTHVRNLLGNTGFAVANGHWRVWKAGGALNTVAADIGAPGLVNITTTGKKFDLQAAQDYVVKLRRLGVIHESTRAGELLDVMKDAGKSDIETFTEGAIKKAVKNTTGIFPTLYRLEDDVWKVFAFENEVARYTRAFPNASTAEIEARAAEIVRNTYPTYSLVPRGVKMLRRFPLVGTFVSFPAEVIRTAGNTVRIAARELRDPATREIGMERLAGIMVAASGTAIIANTSRQMVGIALNDEEDMRRLLPEWSQNSQLLHLGKTPEGDPRYIDLSYVDPHEYLKKPLIALLRGATDEELEKGILEAAIEAGEPFLSEEIMASKLLDVSRNVNSETGGRIWNPEDDPHEQLWDASKHILDALNPGTVRSITRVAKGLGNQPGLGGLELDAKTEAIGALTGQRLSILNRKRSYGFQIRNRLKEFRNADGLLGRVAQDRNKLPMPEEDLVEAYNKAEDRRREIFDEMVKDAEAIQRLGLPISTVQQIMKASNMSKEQMGRVLLGLYIPRMPDARFLDSFFESVTVAANTPEERIRAQREVIRRKQIIQQAAAARIRQFQEEQATQPTSP